MDKPRSRATKKPPENLLSQIFFQRYNSNLPTSLTNFLPSTRGFSPWVPDAVVGTNRWRVLRRSSIFQDALGDSDGNKKHFRFSGISRTSPNDLIAVLERKHTAGRNQLSSQMRLPPSKVTLIKKRKLFPNSYCMSRGVVSSPILRRHFCTILLLVLES